MKQHTVQGGGGVRLNVVESGQRGAPSLLFLHGISQGYGAWAGQLDALAERFHVAAFDLRGHGASEKPFEAAAYHDERLWAEDVRAVMAGLRLTRPVLVARSYGGIVALDYLKTFGTEEVAGLVLVAALTNNAVKGAAEHLGEGVEHLKAMLSPKFDVQFAGARAFVSESTAEPLSSDELTRHLALTMMTPPQVRFNLASRKVEHRETLQKLDLPVLCIHGERDRVVRVSSSHHTVAVSPNALLKLYEEVGHLPFLEAAERFNQDVREFAVALT